MTMPYRVIIRDGPIPDVIYKGSLDEAKALGLEHVQAGAREIRIELDGAPAPTVAWYYDPEVSDFVRSA